MFLDILKKVAPLKSNPNLEEVSNAAVYLLSDMSNGVTGTTHYVDGGLKLVGIPGQQILVNILILLFIFPLRLSFF